MVATAPLPHKLVDIRSAERYGPQGVTRRLPCDGLLEPDGGFGHGYISTICTGCGLTIAIPERSLDGLVAKAEAEAREKWWQK